MKVVALQNATMAIGRSRRPRGPTYARGTNRSLFENQELANNAQHLATRRAHPAFKLFTSLIPEAEVSFVESWCQPYRGSSSSVPSFAYGPFCGDTSGLRCDAAPGVASVVESRRVASASGPSADIIFGANSGRTTYRKRRARLTDTLPPQDLKFPGR
jgi:hypothetical protein